MLQKGFSIAGRLKASNRTDAQGRLGRRLPVAIIDIGSNSVRQVVYEGLTRAPSILFNEKVLCGLGKGVAANGRLEAEAAARALRAVRRFSQLGVQMGVGETHVLATAAAREAENGSRFLREVEKLTGKKPRLLTGEEEADLAAKGIKAAFHEPEGIAGDLGGGSVEFRQVHEDAATGVSTKLGALRLSAMFGDDLKAVSAHVRKKLNDIEVPWPTDARTFYAIGGTWRSLARLHMLEVEHPVDVVHCYTTPAKDYVAFCKQVAAGKLDEFKGISQISSNRTSLLPYGAIVMVELLKWLEAETVSMSSAGLREGYIYSLLDAQTRKRDALMEATSELSVLRARSPRHSKELVAWTDKAFDVFGFEETVSQKRWRHAACNLADIAWRSSSDFRAEQTLGIIANAGFNSISHEGRAYLALATFHRYRGLGANKQPPAIATLADETSTKYARVLAATFRVLYLFSAAESGVLPKIEIRHEAPDGFVLAVPAKLKDLIGERPMVRVEQLSKELDVPVRVQVD